MSSLILLSDLSDTNSSKELDEKNQANRISPPQADEPVLPGGRSRRDKDVVVHVMHVVRAVEHRLIRVSALSVSHAFNSLLILHLGVLRGSLRVGLSSMSVVSLDQLLDGGAAGGGEKVPVSLQALVNSIAGIRASAQSVNVVGALLHGARILHRLFLSL